MKYINILLEKQKNLIYFLCFARSLTSLLLSLLYLIGMLSSSPASSRVVLVTGANQGIGYEVVRQLAQQGGHTVYLGARSMTRVKRLCMYPLFPFLPPLLLYPITAFILSTSALCLSFSLLLLQSGETASTTGLCNLL